MLSFVLGISTILVTSGCKKEFYLPEPYLSERTQKVDMCIDKVTSRSALSYTTTEDEDLDDAIESCRYVYTLLYEAYKIEKK